LRIFILRKSGKPDLRRARVGVAGSREFGVCGLPPSLALPRKGGGNMLNAGF
jgi:hypothetical protein